MLKPIYVIGHRNPDLDSVASAVGYAGLKNHLQGELHVAAVAGELNPESRFALERFGLAPPAPVTDVRARVEDLLEDEPGASVGPEERLSTFSALFRDRGVKTLAVVDDRRRLLGLMTLGDVALLYLEALGGPEADADAAPAALRRILGLTARQVMKTEGLVVLEASETVEEARKHMLASRFRNYPVVDDDNRFLGMVGRYHLLQMKRKRVVLVDHNERMQAVEGIEEAEILEIIDHHRLGDLQTSAPIYVRSEPLGATSTLVTEMYAERGVPVPPPVAGLLVSGILSDTMLFRSPTTTERDRRAAGVLAAAAGLDLEQWGRELLRHSARPQPASAEELIQADLKEYQAGTEWFAVAQVETIDRQAVAGGREALRTAMEELCARRGYGFMLLMLTDVFREGTELIAAGRKAAIAAKAFGVPLQEGGAFLPGVMSRKQQVIPVLFKVLAEESLIGP